VAVGARRWFAAAGAVYAAVWLWSWGALPERVATHFTGSGRPDAWSSRPVALAVTAVLGAGTALVFVALVRLVRGARVGWINVPHPGYWKQPANLGRLRALMAEDVWLLGAWTLLLLAAVQALVVRAARLPEPRLDGWALGVVGLYLAVVVARAVWSHTRRYAVPGLGG
jgi:uncharacterized membrane protein